MNHGLDCLHLRSFSHYDIYVLNKQTAICFMKSKILKPKLKGMLASVVAHACNPSQHLENGAKGLRLQGQSQLHISLRQASLGYIMNSCLKQQEKIIFKLYIYIKYF